MNDISKFIKIMESSERPKNEKILFEAPWSRNPRSEGERKRSDLVKKMSNAWNEWLGTTGHEGTKRDILNFLVSRVGFSKSDAGRILTIADQPIVGGSSNNDSDNTNDDGNTENKPSGGGDSGSSSENTSEKTQEKPKNTEKLPEPIITDKFKNISGDSSYSDIAYNLKLGLLKKQKTPEVLSSLYNTLQHVRGTSDSVPVELLKSYKNLVDDSIDILSQLPTSNKFHIDDSNAFLILQNLSKRIADSKNNTTESIIYEADNVFLDQPLTKQEVNDIFDDAAKFAFSNNIIGNKSYARDNGVGADSGNQNTNSGSNSNTSGLSKPVEKASHLSDFATKVYNSAIQGTGDVSQERIGELRALSKKSFDQLTPEDRASFSAMGWAFLRNLGR